MRFDLNCDLGEGESPALTKALMRNITSANVACGGHAGDAASMRLCVRLAKKYSVRLGAHPGFADRKHFGRSSHQITPQTLELLLLLQVGMIEQIAAERGLRLHHIKLHGALYHATENDRQLAKHYLGIVRRHWPKLIVYALAGGTVARYARSARVTVWEEAFLDRNYLDDGSLAARNHPQALLTDPAQVEKRLELLRSRKSIAAINGRLLPVSPQTLCIHSDTPAAVRLAELARKQLS